MKTPFFAVLIGAVALLAGCSTVQSRIEEKQHVYNTLDPQTQSKIREGVIDIGYTPDMVYMAMGQPDERRTKVTSDGEEMTWIYSQYWQQYEGSRLAGYRRVVFYDPAVRAYRVYLQPVHADIYSEREEERTRVVFKDGRVSSIEQLKS
jgi:hypothetical protein